MKIRNVFHIIFITTLSLALSSCATIDSRYSGFLDDYSNMKPSEIVEGFMVDKHPTKNLGDYNEFYVDPVIVYFHEDAKGVSVEADKLKELTDAFHTKAVAALERNYTVLDEPKQCSLIIRAAITDVFPNKPYLNFHWSTTLAGFGLGGASMEAEFVDAITEERILAVVDSRLGKRSHYTKGWSKWGHPEDILDQWVQILIDNLNMLHGIVEEPIVEGEKDSE